ncbi:unnamed protein product [Callosobruchus maculatus]|uniref:Uncharacterized protein n=1 Tax=Callosobruchus maculatus TaxID=64391 RepID=A0A653D4G1_CALMS|nr:unnamed protein product [Callosobruchus maculatus]
MSGSRGKKLVNLAQTNSIPIFSDDNIQLGTFCNSLSNGSIQDCCDGGQFEKISETCVIVEGAMLHDNINIHYPNVSNDKNVVQFQSVTTTSRMDSTDVEEAGNNQQFVVTDESLISYIPSQDNHNSADVTNVVVEMQPEASILSLNSVEVPVIDQQAIHNDNGFTLDYEITEDIATGKNDIYIIILETSINVDCIVDASKTIRESDSSSHMSSQEIREDSHDDCGKKILFLF